MNSAIPEKKLKNEEAKRTLTIALNLKPDYQEAKELLEQLAKPTVDN